jgi:hypothetical protein
VDIVAIDWSGAARGAADHIWLAHVREGALVDLRSGRTRSEVVADLIALRGECSQGLVVGLDFSFSFPGWFMRERGYTSPALLWQAARHHGEVWLADCAPPFWGRPGRRRPDLPAHLRQAEMAAAVGGIRAKSVFQIGGAGSVGTGTLRGMPYLPDLSDAGFSIWPFDPPSPSTVLEIYPRLLTGPVNKGRREHRSRYLTDCRWSIAPSFTASIVGSDDAFDAAISALVMNDHAADLGSLCPTTDPVRRLEGDVWRPLTISP